MGKSGGGRDWTQIYAIYGINEWQTLMFLLIHAFFFSFLSVLFLLYFGPICLFLQETALLPPPSARFAAGFTGAVTALSSVCLFFAAANFLYSSVPLQWEMAQRMVGAVGGEWSRVRHALDVGCCGRGILLNAVAKQLKKEGSGGRVVGLESSTERRAVAMAATLRAAAAEGVQEYVTCREGDARSLPFADNYFEVVVSGAFVHRVGKEMGQRTAAAAAERMRVVMEVVRVLKPGGVGVVWDRLHVPEYVHRLKELRMEDITVSEGVTAFMVTSQIVSFRKPRQHHHNHQQQQQLLLSPAAAAVAGEVRLDWRFPFPTNNTAPAAATTTTYNYSSVC